MWRYKSYKQWLSSSWKQRRLWWSSRQKRARKAYPHGQAMFYKGLMIKQCALVCNTLKWRKAFFSIIVITAIFYEPTIATTYQSQSILVASNITTSASARLPTAVVNSTAHQDNFTKELTTRSFLNEKAVRRGVGTTMCFIIVCVAAATGSSNLLWKCTCAGRQVSSQTHGVGFTERPGLYCCMTTKWIHMYLTFFPHDNDFFQLWL